MTCTLCQERPATSRGLCSACYQRERKAGRLAAHTTRQRAVCSVDGCAELAASEGLFSTLLPCGSDPGTGRMTDTWMPKITPPTALRHCPWCHKKPEVLEHEPCRYHVHCLTEKCPVNPCTGSYDDLDKLCKDWNSIR